jgi:hypothetical protein
MAPIAQGDPEGAIGVDQLHAEQQQARKAERKAPNKIS